MFSNSDQTNANKAEASDIVQKVHEEIGDDLTSRATGADLLRDDIAAAKALPSLEIVDDGKLDTASIKPFFDKHFDELDRDKDGRVNQDELDRALESGKFEGDDAVVLLTVRDHYTDVLNAEYGDDNPNPKPYDPYGLTEFQLEKFDDIQALDKQIVPSLARAQKYAQENFDVLDQNKDGKIDRDEVKNRIYDRNISALELDEANNLRRRYGTISRSVEDNPKSQANEKGEAIGMTRADVERSVDEYNRDHRLRLAAERSMDWYLDKQERIDEHQDELADAREIKQLADEKFSALDRDRNDAISMRDLEFAKNNPAFTEAERRVIAKMIEHFKTLQHVKASPEGKPMKEIDEEAINGLSEYMKQEYIYNGIQP
ncbi:MAG TPA: hypothetical protein V6D17_02570 [Candidatus Obscuribacterales bacterium]